MAQPSAPKKDLLASAITDRNRRYNPYKVVRPLSN